NRNPVTFVTDEIQQYKNAFKNQFDHIADLDLARSTGALKRARKVRDPETLLLLIMSHAATGLSLNQTSARAKRLGIASISKVALFKRMRNAETWLHELAVRMFAASPFDHTAGTDVTDRRIRGC
ncbi:hypothetical protein AKJ40_03200, partial [candidate division MSBL1 archaeon SCGC-AAA259M10]